MFSLRERSAFTLIELSIVLIIISLIVGGIIGGKSLIKSAKLKSIISEVNGFKTAINIYQDNYDYLPGDHPTTDSYWPTDCITFSSRPCNGNGNGYIGKQYTPYAVEVVRMWEHLSLAEYFLAVICMMELY